MLARLNDAALRSELQCRPTIPQCIVLSFPSLIDTARVTVLLTIIYLTENRVSVVILAGEFVTVANISPNVQPKVNGEEGE